ncbi:alkylated DNA repair protein alkB homolog 8-like [Panonychus citri]|uniref:alkylated DNA repair protein alkB homolog 8-like n=1 Tax=Panonychus citri TaxID=50023 RepID=UPI0023083218|nr:alkylated DNA repair protein alkB homolog 8-like [Panonychus citri]
MSSFRSIKVNKRQFKYLKSLANDLKVDPNCIESNCSTNILLANVGLLTGNNYEDIFNLFSTSNCIENIFLFTNQRYSLIKFDNIDSAIEAVNKFNGNYNSSLDKVIYLIQIADDVANRLINQSQQSIINQFKYQPEGLSILNEIISEDEESMLINLIDWSSDGKVEHLKNRKVKHFGRRFDYMVNGIVDDETIDSIPDCLRKLFTKWFDDQVINYIPDQLTVNLYEKGQGIPMHIDTHSCCENEIVSLSLGSPIVMDFERIKSVESSFNSCSVLLNRRSLLILKDEARYCWNHGIACRKFDVSPHPENSDRLIFNQRSTRISFTLRKSKNSDCSCDFPEFCDSQQGKEIKITNSAEMEDQYVYKVYDEIAGDFSRTRYKPWPKVKQFIDSLGTGSILCDIGCGNGKYLNLNRNIFNIGSDTSLQLLEICKHREMEVIGCNILNLPFRSSSVDHLICIAVIHHLSSEERRVSSLNEMSRILIPGGTGLVYVWALEQVKDGNKSVYIKTKGNDQQITEPLSQEIQSCLPVHCNRTEFKQQDLFVPWKDKNKEKQFLRYYHVFRENELENLFQHVNSLEIIESYYDQGNWCVIFRKKFQINQ